MEIVEATKSKFSRVVQLDHYVYDKTIKKTQGVETTLKKLLMKTEKFKKKVIAEETKELYKDKISWKQMVTRKTKL